MARRSSSSASRLLRQLESSRLSSTLRRRLACASLSASDASSMQSASQRSSSALALRVGEASRLRQSRGIFSWRVKVGTRGRSGVLFLGSAEEYLRRAGPGSIPKPPSSSACISSSSNSSAVGKGEGRSRVGAQERVRSASVPARYARARGDVGGARHEHSRRRHGRGWSHRAKGSIGALAGATYRADSRQRIARAAALSVSLLSMDAPTPRVRRGVNTRLAEGKRGGCRARAR